jgi:hypothetical protein
MNNITLSASKAMGPDAQKRILLKPAIVARFAQTHREEFAEIPAGRAWNWR